MSIIGKTLKERYEILDLAGSGGMADVYRASDRKLERIVAVKVLKKDLARDKEFVRRFHREARSAAKMSHSGILAVYDIEEEDGLVFIVMEYVDGIDMKTWLKGKKVLSQEQAIPIVRSILEALSYAHSRGIIHRDIKPQNILMKEDGSVKVADFGIARAMFSDTITQTGSFLGSVHYFSPEQAQGKPTSAPADLYSLGILLFECLTGRLPFDGDNQVSVALKQVQETPPLPSSLNPDISPGMDAFIMKALQKNPLMRFQSADEMLEELNRLDGQGGIAREQKAAAASQPTLLRPPSKARENLEEVSYRLSRKNEDAGDEDPQEREFPYIKTIALVLGLILTVVIVAVIWVYSTNQIAEITTPDFTGRPYVEAQMMASEQGLSLSIQKELFSDRAEGIVLDQNPKAGVAIKTGRIIYITLSKGVSKIEMPDLRGMDMKACERLLRDRGLTNIRVIEEFSDDFAASTVMSHNPVAQYMVTAQTPIVLRVSKGPNMKRMPDLKGRTEADARKILEPLKIKMTVSGNESSQDIPAGSVVSQSIAAGASVRQDMTVSVVLSKGAQSLVVPNLVGKSVSEAKNIAESFQMALIFENENQDDHMIVSQQTPAAGEVIAGRSITVWADSYTVVPVLTGRKPGDAGEILSAAGLQLGEVIYDTAGSAVQPDLILEQEPASGLEVPLNTKVKIVVSGRPAESPGIQAVTEQGTVEGGKSQP